MHSNSMSKVLDVARSVRLAAIIAALALGAGVLLGGSPVASAGGGFCHSPTAREGNDGDVSLNGYCFLPTVMRVQTHSTVRFRNIDPVPHLVTGAAVAWGGEEQLPAGAVFDAAFDVPGLYPYSCQLHPGMTGVIVVGDGAFPGNAGVPAIKALASGQAAAEFPAPSASSPAASNSPRWLYAGMGVLGGLAVAGLGFGFLSARRPDRS
jgi:plastocyanin